MERNEEQGPARRKPGRPKGSKTAAKRTAPAAKSAGRKPASGRKRRAKPAAEAPQQGSMYLLTSYVILLPGASILASTVVTADAEPRTPADLRNLEAAIRDTDPRAANAAGLDVLTYQIMGPAPAISGGTF